MKISLIKLLIANVGLRQARKIRYVFNYGKFGHVEIDCHRNENERKDKGNGDVNVANGSSYDPM